MTDTPVKFLGWRMVFLAFLAVNLGTYLTGGVYGVIVQDLQQRFGLDRGTVSLAISTQIFACNLSAPVMGWLAARFSLRKLMLAAAALQGAAYFTMGIATHFYEILICYAFNGFGYVILGVIAPYTLVSRWFEVDRAKALGFMSIPLALVFAPPVAAKLAITFGSQGVFFATAACYFLLLPLLLLVVDRPENVGQSAWKGSTAATDSMQTPATARAGMTNRQLLASWPFWLLTIGYALITGPAHVFVAHAVPFAMQRASVSLEAASVLMAVFGGAGLVGTVLCGWLADKVGAVRGLIVVAVGSAFGWAGLLLSHTLWPMIAAACLIGIMANAIAAVHTSSVNDLFGKESVPTVTGLTFFVRLPLMVSFPWIAGRLYDITGAYQLPFTIQIVGYLLAATGFAIIVKFRGRGAA
jgi:MFS family permease